MSRLQSRQVATAFGLKAAEYERFADYQRDLAHQIFAMLRYRGTRPRRWLDCGCGTGMVHRCAPPELRPHTAVGLDIAPAALRLMSARTPGHAVCGDIERLPFRPRAFDLVTLNAVLQWTSPAEAIGAAVHGLRTGGTLVIGALAGSHLEEFQESLRAVGVAPPARFIDGAVLRRMLRSNGCVIIDEMRRTSRRVIPDPLWLIKRMSRIGAAPRIAAHGRSSVLFALCRQYRRRYHAGAGVAATYDLLTIMARRDGENAC
jgi:SAM-dependent methyltransferase